jgi:ADP-dependent NAD(P)H-hydrate dehydratase / NAD(P)H-hydrate epimerase
MQNLPDKLYSVDSVVRLEQVAIHQFGIPAYELMKRAGEAVFNVVASKYSQHKKILVLCGAGNNAGDGYVVASLAKQAGFDVWVISLTDPQTLKNEARLAYEDWLTVGENTHADLSLIDKSDLIVDALLGTGLTRPVSAEWAELISVVNDSANPVVSVDIPSGLFANTGVISGSGASDAIRADVTVSFIGLKRGMFTAQAGDVCGEIIFSDLGLPDEVYQQVKCDARLIKQVNRSLLAKRKASSHKGCFGHVLIAGGNEGMPGAVILAARAALRTGAGLVTIITVPQHLAAISAAVPEAMIKTCVADLDAGSDTGLQDGCSVEVLFKQGFISKVTHVAVGMGLGQDDWSLKVLQHCVQLHKPMLIDADGLNVLAKHRSITSMLSSSAAFVITPHPGEAGRLLSSSLLSSSQTVSTANIQSDRFEAVKKLRALFPDKTSCTVILKGSGTLIFDGTMINVCALGNAAMAAPGMGDVLSGIVIALMAQVGDDSEETACDIAELAVCLHASAAGLVAGDKTRGLLASDVIEVLPKVLL